MSKRRRKNNLNLSPEDGDPYFAGNGNDMYQAPKGKKPRGKAKRKSGAHKTAYWD